MSGSKSPYDNQIIRSMQEASELQRQETLRGFENLAKSIDALAVNIAQLTVQQKVTANNLDKLGEKLDKMGDRLDQMITAIDGDQKTAQMNAANIAELTKLATALASR